MATCAVCSRFPCRIQLPPCDEFGYDRCMIGRLVGSVVEYQDGFVILDVNGVGYLMRVTTDTMQKLKTAKKEVALLTHLVVRENTLDLYGFLEREELTFFELLLSVSGIGPKSAIAILSIADTGTLFSAIAEGNSAYLTKVAGIGKKMAGKIVLELRDKIGAPTETISAAGQHDADVLEALKSLGYQTGESREALKQVPRETEGAGGRLKAALKILGK